MQIINEIGNRYWNLLVVEKVQEPKSRGARWVCLCDCGNRVLVYGSQLRRGKQKSCGCNKTKYRDLLGKKFGKWLILKEIEGQRDRMFLCRCDCGKEKTVFLASLVNGTSKSCGHAHDLPVGEASFRALYRYTKCNAGYRGVDFCLSLEFFRWITKQNCHYCGAEPSQVYGKKRPAQKHQYNGLYTYNGVDRVDNNVGYLEYNCVPCCGNCNNMKSAWDVNEFKSWIVTVYNHWASK